jgi:preprotein translocase subunit SecF
MIMVSLALALILTIAIVVRWQIYGSPVPLSIEFSGGTLINIRGLENRPDAGAVEQALGELLTAKVEVKVTVDHTSPMGEYGLDVLTQKELSDNEKELVRKTLKERFGIVGSYSTQWAGGIITSIFRGQAERAIIGAFIAMGVIILIVFKHAFAVGSILICISLNMLGIIGGMAIFSVPLSLGSTAGILMVLGYSVDTNILLSMRVLKRLGGETRERVAEAMRTGLMMSGATLVVLTALNLFTTAPLLFQLSAALIFGILADIVNTWFFNAGMLTWYAERRLKREYYVGE